jgi:tetratricopeptide (TPR) repeat protein
MLSFVRSVLVAVLLISFLQLGAFADDANAPALHSELGADQLYRAGKFAEADAKYQALLKTDSTLVAAQAGIVRAMLRQQKIDEPLDKVNTELGAQSNSAALLAAKKEVQFRRAEMPDAEIFFLRAKKVDPKEVHAYLGLARLYRSYSLYRKAYDELQIAHEIAPDDIEVKKSGSLRSPKRENGCA